LLLVLSLLLWYIPESIAQIHVPAAPHLDSIQSSARHVEPGWIIVEQLPLFPGCADFAGTREEKHKCSDRAFAQYIQRRINHSVCPDTGFVHVKFLVEEDGWITNITTESTLKRECVNEAVRVIASMNEMPEKWNAALRNKKPVRVQMEAVVKF
jgi:hypothetical protein